MKIVTRIVMAYIVVGHLVIFTIAPYSTENVEIFGLKDWMILTCGGLYILSVFFIWWQFFHDWGMTVFTDVRVKRRWFWVILAGGFLYFIGPLIYYVIVYEMHKGVKENFDRKSREK